MSPGIYGQLIFNKGTKNTQWRKAASLQQTVLGKLKIHKQKNELGSLSYTKQNIFKKSNSKWIKDLNIRPETKIPIRKHRVET